MTPKFLTFFLFLISSIVFADKAKETPPKKSLGYLPTHSPSGKIIKLEHFKGQLLLVCFWASYDKASIQTLKTLKTLHDKFNRGGFEVLAVSMDNNLSSWMQTIQQEDFSWMHHVSDLDGWQSKSMVEMNVSSLPYFFLLDEGGAIVEEGSQTKFVEVEKKVKHQFSNVFRVFPESSANELWFTKEVKFELQTEQGSVLHKGSANALDVSSLSSGVYWLLIDGNKFRFEKLVTPDHVYFYPKRVNDVVRFSESTPYKLFNRRGIVVREGFGNSMNVENLPEGVYYLWLNGMVERLLKK